MECVQSQWNACPMSCDPMKCEYRIASVCGIWITANGIWIQPTKWKYCYIYSFFITSNITSLPLIDIPRAPESAARVSRPLQFSLGSAARISRPLSLFSLPPEKRSGPQTKNNAHGGGIDMPLLVCSIFNYWIYSIIRQHWLKPYIDYNLCSNTAVTSGGGVYLQQSSKLCIYI